MWTQHAQRAASVAAEMVERTYRLKLPSDKREQTWNHRLALVRQQTAAQIMGVYGNIAGRSVLLIGPRAVRQLANAQERTDGRIPDAECRAIIQAGRARAERAQPRAIGDDGVLRDLMSIGLLHLDMSLGPNHDEITWSIAMGSLTGHILAGVKDNEPPDKPAGEAVRNPSQQPGPTATMAITPPQQDSAVEPSQLDGDSESSPK